MRHKQVAAELVPPSTLGSQCYKSQCDLSIAHHNYCILQPRQCRIGLRREQRLLEALCTFRCFFFPVGAPFSFQVTKVKFNFNCHLRAA